MNFVPKKERKKILKKLSDEHQARQKERNKEIRAKALKYSQEFDEKHGL